MKLTRHSSLVNVAAEVAKALGDAGITAVLTGGACTTLYSDGEYQSSNLDFILQSRATQRQLDAAMGSIDFRRKTNRYEHPESRFFVEFPPGPLGIGTDIDIEPVAHKIGNVTVKLLSATDSCRDRLSAFYHWNDRQSLDTALRIALHNKIDVAAIGKWSSGEGAAAGFGEFHRALRSLRNAGRVAGKKTGSRKPRKRK